LPIKLEDPLMALWKETPAPTPAPSGNPAAASSTITELHKGPATTAAQDNDATRRLASAPKPASGESVIGSDLTIEGKIQGGGDVRIAGRFKGDVIVDGNFRIDAGARLEGQVKASVVIVGGELQGNIDAAKHVDVLSSGVIVGDVKAASITVAAGSRMRGHVEFGWDDKHNTSLKGATRQV
jgi:cytoskeletal protein CcmA (bactofilin family)